MSNILAAVVTYNRLNTLKDCISHIMGQTAPCDLLIVDNASTDGTGEWASSQKGSSGHQIIYENTGSNLGGAGGFNYAMRRCCELGYEYIWIMDDDAFPEPDCLEKLLSAAEELSYDFGFLSSIVLWTDGNICRMNWQRKYDLPKKRSEHHISDNDLTDFSKRTVNSISDRVIRIQSATFVSLLFPAKVIRMAGLPIKEFFIWCDDIEFTRRISLKYGLPCYAVLDSRIIHHIANNNGTDISTDSPERISRYNYAFRNENYMYRQYGIKGFGYYCLVCGYNTVKIIKNAPGQKRERLSVVFKNFFKGLSFNPPVEKL